MLHGASMTATNDTPKLLGSPRSPREVVDVGVLYTVKQGDHLMKIAERFGFSTYETIWNRPENAELKNKRDSPNLLLPGDRLFIPDKDDKTVDAATGRLHRFKLKQTKLKL